MLDPEISVIVPVYNVEKYLPYCIQSLLRQTYKNFEIILIDDGSTDKSSLLCDEYEKEYHNIYSLHKENGGLSDARNYGISFARGEYITFIDSDDYVNELYLELLIISIKQTKADFSVVGVKKVYDYSSNDSYNKNEILIRRLESEKALECILYQQFHDVSAWGMLLPKSLVSKNIFPLGRLFEDLFTTYKFYLSTNNVAFVYAPLYYYYQRSNSIMNKLSEKYIVDLIDASNCLLIECRNSITLKKAAENKKFSNFCLIINKCDDLEKRFPKCYKQIKKYLLEHSKSILINNKCRIKNRFAAFVLLLFGVKCLRRIDSLLKSSGAR